MAPDVSGAVYSAVRGVLWGLVALFVVAFGALLPSHADEGERGDGERYEVLIERNIFSPTRGQRPEPPPRRPAERPQPEPREVRPPDPGRSMVLRGFAVRGEQAVAMIEAEGGQLHRVGVGDTVAGRRVTHVAIDELTIQRDDETRTITVGMTLAGDTAPRVEQRSGGGGDSGGSVGGGSGGRSDVLERMRQRSQQARQQGGGGEDDSQRSRRPEREPEPEPEGEPAMEREPELEPEWQPEHRVDEPVEELPRMYPGLEPARGEGERYEADGVREDDLESEREFEGEHDGEYEGEYENNGA